MTNTFTPLVSTEFRKYVAGTMLSAIGNGMHFVAMTWLVYHQTGATVSIALNMIIATLPGMLISPWIGVLIDRWRNKWICVGADMARGAILLGIVIAVSIGKYVIETVYVTTFLISVCNILFQPSVSALVRDISARESLLGANVLSNMCFQVGMLTGASLGGFIVAEFSVTTVVGINILSFFVSGALTAWVKVDTRDISTGRPYSGIWREMGATLDYLGRNRYIFWIALVQMFGSVILYICNTLLPVFVYRELGADTKAFGVIDAAWGAGAIAGGIALTSGLNRLKQAQITYCGPLLLSLSIFIFLSAQGVAHAVAGYFSLGFVVCVVRVSTDTQLSSDVDREYFGKVKSIITMFISYVSLAVYAIVGYLGDHVSIRSIFLGAAVTIFSCFLFRSLQSRFIGNLKRSR